MPIRGLDELLNDLSLRQRVPTPSKNKILQKIAIVQDVVVLSTDAVFTTVTNAPTLRWAPAASTADTLIWGFGEWR